MTLYGFGDPTRDYVHVSDVARALVGSIGTPGTYNIATRIETSVREVYDLARIAVPDSTSPEPELAPLRPGELQASCLDTTLAAEALGWTPQIDVATGIPGTVRSLLSA
jgi:UDP-glucose 4-epimerase